MNVRPEAPPDREAIRGVHEEAFPTSSEARLVDALREAGHLWLSLVAEEEEEGVVGHVAFSPVSMAGAKDGVGLGPVAVQPAFQQRGIGHLLIRKGLAICRRSNRGFVVVLGDPRYYSRFGFTPASDWKLRDEYGGGHAFQALELRPGAIPDGGGLVYYSPEFAAAAT